MAESQPLLGTQHEGTLPDIDSNPTVRLPDSTFSRHLRGPRKGYFVIASERKYQIVACTFVAYMLAEFGMFTLQIPCARLLERTVCRNYYNKLHSGILNGIPGEIDERLCKIHPIQAEVATLAGWRDSLLSIPCILTAVFYGSLADRIGRKPVLLLSGLGESLVVAWIVFVCYFDWIFPTRLIWASAAFVFIGGGHRVFVGILFTMVADTVDESHRTRYLYLLATGPYVSGLITPAIEAATMSVNVWLPFIVAITVYMSMLLVVLLFMPETRQTTEAPVAGCLTPEPNLNGSATIDTETTPAILGPISTMIKIPNLAICFVLFFIKRTGFMSENLFYLHASAKFDLELRQTPWFRSAKSIGGILVLIFILPTINTFLRTRGISPQTIDLRVIRGSMASMVIAFSAVFVSPSPWFFAAAVVLCGAGDGIDPGIHGLASTFVTAAHRAKMFTLLAMIDAAGKIIGGPLMATLYSVGMDSAGKSAGICFLTAAFLFGTGLILSFGIRLERQQIIL